MAYLDKQHSYKHTHTHKHKGKHRNSINVRFSTPLLDQEVLGRKRAEWQKHRGVEWRTHGQHTYTLLSLSHILMVVCVVVRSRTSIHHTHTHYHTPPRRTHTHPPQIQRVPQPATIADIFLECSNEITQGEGFKSFVS